jgi:hypothetical protein
LHLGIWLSEASNVADGRVVLIARVLECFGEVLLAVIEKDLFIGPLVTVRECGVPQVLSFFLKLVDLYADIKFALDRAKGFGVRLLQLRSLYLDVIIQRFLI